MYKILCDKIRKKLVKFLKKILRKKLRGHYLRRLRKLAAFIAGMLKSRSRQSDLRSIGKGLYWLTNAYSREKAAKRFMYNKWISYEDFYQPYLEVFINKLLAVMNMKHLTLIIDGSNVGNDHACLMVSLAFKKRAIPLRWIIKEGNKGHFANQDHLDLIQAVRAQFSNLMTDCEQVTLLGDGEFDSIALQTFCKDHKWNYVFRTARDTVMYEQDDRFQPKNLQVYKGQDHFFIPDVEFTNKRFKHINFLLWHHPDYNEPIPLISNLDDALSIQQAYKIRFATECLFKDLKSNSFHLHQTRLKDLQAIDNLVTIACFAFTFLVKIAHRYDHPKFHQMVHRIRQDRPVCSFFSFALELIDHFLNHTTAFSFDFSKNSS